jgi:hypothetical protein
MVFSVGALCIVFSVSCTAIVPVLPLPWPHILPAAGLPRMKCQDCRQNMPGFVAMA